MNGIFRDQHSKKCQVQCEVFIYIEMVSSWALAVGEVESESENKSVYEYTDNVLLQRDKTIPSLQNASFSFPS